MLKIRSGLKQLFRGATPAEYAIIHAAASERQQWAEEDRSVYPSPEEAERRSPSVEQVFRRGAATPSTPPVPTHTPPHHAAETHPRSTARANRSRSTDPHLESRSPPGRCQTWPDRTDATRSHQCSPACATHAGSQHPARRGSHPSDHDERAPTPSRSSHPDDGSQPRSSPNPQPEHPSAIRCRARPAPAAPHAPHGTGRCETDRPARPCPASTSKSPPPPPPRQNAYI